MANEVNGILADSNGTTLHIQSYAKYVYIEDMFRFGNCSGGEITREHISERSWVILAEEPLIKWSEE